MRHLLTVALLLWAAPLAAQEFTTEAAKAAQAAYEADLQAAKEKYSAALDDAAKVAVEAGELDEVVRIKSVKDELISGDPMEKTRKAVTGATYLYRYPTGPSGKRTFLPDGTVRVETEGRVTDNWGIWEVVEPRTIIYRNTSGSGNWFFLSFSEDFETATSVRATAIKSNVTSIKRVSPSVEK